MYRVKSNKEIGEHLGILIGMQYRSNRKFAIDFLEKRDGSVDPDDTQKMQNRICQIKKGNKGVQIEDLPIFAELLGVSVDDILSAGTYSGSSASRENNYSIALSPNRNEWAAYLARKDKPFLNPDEFNKTTIDYAMEVENYALLKYLVDNHYIWFVGTNKEEYFMGFGAGTNIKRREFHQEDLLELRMKEKDDLRFRMIALAIKNNDKAMLEKLHAKELPMLYTMNPNFIEDKFPQSQNIKYMLESLPSASDSVLDYFFEAFTVENMMTKKENRFFFPYAGMVIDGMIRKKRKNIKKYMEKVLEWNKSIRERLAQMIDDSEKEYRSKDIVIGKLSKYDADQYDLRVKKAVWSEYYFYPDTGFVVYSKPFISGNTYDSFISNVVCVSVNSGDSGEAGVSEINQLYKAFATLLTNKETYK